MDVPRCQAVIYKRDTYRVSRGNKAQFRMHFNKSQCSRKAADGGLVCTQHNRPWTMLVRSPGT